MTAYILKSSAGLIFLFGLYWFLLRKEKLFVFNRYFLILSIVFSLAFPFLSIPVNLRSSQAEDVFPAFEVPGIETSAENTQPDAGSEISVTSNNPEISLSAVLIILYSSGVLVFLVRFLNNIRSLRRKDTLCPKVYYKGYIVVLTDEKINPCCFLNKIYLNREDYLSGKIDPELLDHEIQHVVQSHTFDILFLEIVKLFYWFNPVHILYSRAIRINHEYLADNEVIRVKSDIRDYSEKLLNYISGKINLSFTSASDHSFTKNRLAMMMKSGSGKIAYSRIAASICLGTLVFFSLSFKEINESVGLSTESLTEGSIQNKVWGTVTTIDGTPIFGASVKTTLANNQPVESITGNDGSFNIDDVLTGASVSFEYRGFNTETVIPDFSSGLNIKLSRDPDFKGIATLTFVQTVKFREQDFTPANALVVIDGKISENLMINPGELRNISILESKDALKKYGEKGKSGVVEITSFKSASGKKINSAPDSSSFETLLSVNHLRNKGEMIDIPATELKEVNVWTYHILDKTDKKDLRTVSIMTRDFYTTNGLVVNENKKALPGVRITMTGSDKVVVSDKSGRFTFEDVRDNSLLEFSMPGYETYYLNTSFGAFKEELTIELTKQGKKAEVEQAQ